MTSAQSLVLLHGFTGAPQSFNELALAGSYTPFLSGHGPQPELSSLTFDQEVTRIAHDVQKLARPIHIVGYSMGARLSLALALSHPELISELSLIGVNPGLQSEAAREERRHWELEWHQLLQSEGLVAFEKKWSEQPLFLSQNEQSGSRKLQQQQIRLSHTALGLCHALKVLGLSAMPNYWPLLPELRVRTRLVVGEHDHKFKEIAQNIAQFNGAISIIEIAGAGHNPLLEAPSLLRAIVLPGSI